MLAPTLREKDRETEALQTDAEYIDLYGDMVEALLSVDPSRVIYAPGWDDGKNYGEAPVHDLVYDELAGKDADWMRCAFTRILGMSATQKENGPLQELALRVVTKIAEEHARTRSGL
jgi:hypothetical protein